jgi:hypothetical protein
MFVESGIDPHVCGSHLFLGELLHLLNGPRGAVLKADAVQALVQVDGVLAGHHLTHRGTLLLVLGRHDEAETDKLGS